MAAQCAAVSLAQANQLPLRFTEFNKSELYGNPFPTLEQHALVYVDCLTMTFKR